jgi:hypothetical protein
MFFLFGVGAADKQKGKQLSDETMANCKWSAVQCFDDFRWQMKKRCVNPKRD